MPLVQLINPNTGQVFDVEESEAGEAARAAKLRPATPDEVAEYDLQKKSGGAVGKATAALSAIPATITDTAQGLLAAKYPALQRPTNEALAGMENPPAGFSQSEQDARRANPGFAAAGGLATDVAAGLAVPGAGLGGLAGRALAAGAVTEGFETLREGDEKPNISPEFTATDALTYAGVAGAFEGVALAAGGVLKGLLPKGQRPPDPVRAGASRARAEALEDVLREPPGPTWAKKVAAFGPEAVETVQKRAVEGVKKAEEAFERATESLMGEHALRRAIPINSRAQERVIVEVAGALQNAAESATVAGTAAAKRMRELAEEVVGQTRRDGMFRAVAKAADELEELGLPANQFIDSVKAQVRDAAANKSTWGRAVENHQASRAVAGAADDLDDAVRSAMKEGPDGPRRVSLEQRLDAMLEAAKSTRNESLEKTVTAARSALERAKGLQGKVDMGSLAEGVATRALKVGVLEKGVRYGLDAVGFSVGGLPGAIAVDFLADKAAPHIVRAGKAVLNRAAPAAREVADRARGGAQAARGASDAPAPGPGGTANASAPPTPPSTGSGSSTGLRVSPAVAVGVGAGAAVVGAAALARGAEDPELKAAEYRENLELLRGVRKYSVAAAARGLVDSRSALAQSTIGKYAKLGTMSAGVASFMGSDQTPRQAFERRKKDLERVQGDPMALIDHLEETMTDLDDIAPELSRAMVAQTFRALSFVQSKIPETIGTSMAHPSGIPPSDIAVRTFGLYYSAAMDPSTVIEDTRNNRVRQEQIEALREVWPEIYQELSAETLAQMSVNRPTVQQRVRMDLLFGYGTALDAALSPELAALASKGAREQDKGQKAPGARIPQRRTQPSIRSAQPPGLAALENRVE